MKRILLLIVSLLPFLIYAEEDSPVVPILRAGDHGIHSYRIPSLVSTPKGTLLLFAEGRLKSWQDRSPTIIVMCRSSDQGRRFFPMQKLHTDERYAFMDPCAVVDRKTRQITLFYAAWDPKDNKNVDKIISFYQTSKDEGKTWSRPAELKQDFSKGRIMGFAPGAGIQIAGGKYDGRLIIPIRIYFEKKGYSAALYSDNHGKSWNYGNRADRGGECQIAQMKDGLYLNLRSNGKRFESFSKDGGINWEPFRVNKTLMTPARGCQGSVLGNDRTIFYCGPEGLLPHKDRDDRGRLSLWESTDQAKTWKKKVLLYDKGAGYSCMTYLKNDKLAVIFEETSDSSFIKKASRPKGWMNLSLKLIPLKALEQD